MKTFLSSIIAFASLALITPPGMAASKPKVYDQVTVVDQKAKSITLYEGPTKTTTYSVTNATRITINNKSGTLAGIKPGMKVTVGHKSGSNTADSITAESLQHPKRGHRGY
jgi:Cu/Ag efflux protein CusF